MTARHDMPFGAQLLADGGARFRLWAPGPDGVQLQVEGGARHAMNKTSDGWHEVLLPHVAAGLQYRYVVRGGDGELLVPDPASRHQPADVHGPSELVDPAGYRWQDAAWRGRPWHEAVVYELHVGTFTPEGTFAAAAGKLDELAALGITAVELMPLSDFPGTRGWGYDGVLPFAPESTYGSPNDLKALVDRAHALGLMVLLDVVYNHFGPEGNYLSAYCPAFFNPAHQTPWGAAINFDGPHNDTVRQFFIHNALYWVEEFHIDGLRLDAIHAIRDDSATHIVDDIAAALREGPGRDRPVHLVLENERNEAHRLKPDGSADAQWNDDVHHAVHVMLTGESDAYYADFTTGPVALLARGLACGFIYQGDASRVHGDAPRGEPSAHLPGTAFVSFLQNHDQIGNRALGERLDALVRTPADARKLEAAYACVLLSPHVPMLFAGEEFAAETPFLFFCDFGPELAEAVVNGRRAEFAGFAAFRDERARERIPDPNAESTFLASKLRWDDRDRPLPRQRRALIGELLALRHQRLVPLLVDAANGPVCGGRSRREGGLIHVDWTLPSGGHWHLAANFGDGPADTIHDAVLPPCETIWRRDVADTSSGLRLQPGGVIVTCCPAREEGATHG